ncbi:plasmid partitioning protein RepB [Paraburkholderia aspalathi]|nr:plasmid partitioning protein RepB [Paraburkholderia aspalathi]
MARKNLLAGLIDSEDEGAVTPAYPMRGASKSMIRSVNELAKQADAYLEGEHVIELDPETVDVSFVADRLGDDQEKFHELLEAVRERGQNTPILVRPHPDVDGRYMVVFGHRRVRVARELGLKVRAVVKVLDDKTHVIAQGQENSARANLSFIEKAMFAKRLEEMGYDRETISSALSTNAAAISKMVTVVTRVPMDVIQHIGAAPAVGRERWLELSLLVTKKADEVLHIITGTEFELLNSNERFERLFSGLNLKGKPVRKTLEKPAAIAWAPSDKSVSVSLKKTPKRSTLSLTEKDNGAFAEYINGQLEALYEGFKQSQINSTGD